MAPMLTRNGCRRLGLSLSILIALPALAACGTSHKTAAPRRSAHVEAVAPSSWGAADAIQPGTPAVDAVYGPPGSAISSADAGAGVPAGEDFTSRWFSASSPWNSLVTTIPTDPRSTRLLHAAMERVSVVEQPDGRPPKTSTVLTNAGLYINTVAWTDAVVSGGPETPIHCRQSVCGDDGITQLRIPADVSPNPYYDGWFTVISPDGRTAYDMWRARRLPSGAMSFQYMRIWNLDGRGYGSPSQTSARGSGLPLFAGEIRPAELSAGMIDHALAISVPAPAQRYYVQPASTTDGNGALDSLPEGARIRLKANVKLNPKLKLTAKQRRYASALIWTLRNYGAIVVGRSAVPTLYGQGGVTASMLAGNELQSLKLTDFQVVKMPVELQYPSPAAGTAKLASLPASTASASSSTSTVRVTASSRPLGQLVVDGTTSGSLTGAAARDYSAGGGADTVAVEDHGANRAFSELCAGTTDVVDSTVPMSESEQAACARAGIRPVQLQVGSEGVVLATENETDVGADCLTMAQVRATFRAGSPVTNWAQLGFDTIGLSLAGPNPAGNALESFGESLSGTGDPSLLDFRYDYKSEATEAAIREFVVGTSGEGELASETLPSLNDTVVNLRRLLTGAEATESGAAKWFKQASYQVTKGIADGRSVTAQAQDLANQSAAQKKLTSAKAALAQLRAQLASARARVAASQKVVADGRRSLGRLGTFDYSYYSLFEQQLRPLEISSAADPENCVFPSQQTITSGEYPLSRQLLLTVSLQELRHNEGLRLFLESYLSHATALAGAAAMVPLPSDVLSAEQDWLSGAKITSSPAAAKSTGTSVTSLGDENSMSISAGTSAVTTTTTTTESSGQSGASSGIPSGVH